MVRGVGIVKVVEDRTAVCRYSKYVSIDNHIYKSIYMQTEGYLDYIRWSWGFGKMKRTDVSTWEIQHRSEVME